MNDQKQIPFLEKVAEMALSENVKNLENIAFVLPSQRAGLFLKKYLAQLVGENFWAPQIFTINEFTNRHSTLELADPLVLLFELYVVYENLLKDKAESFESFMKWGALMVADFNDIDSSLAQQNIFTDLKNIKELENNSLLSENLTDNQSQYLLFWNNMVKIYKNYNDHLSDLKIGYQGKIAKDLAENAAMYFDNTAFKKIYFAGFSALTKAEQKIILFLVENKKSAILWDTDSYYMDDENAEAGAIIRKIKPLFPSHFKWKENKLIENKKQIHFYSSTQNLSQVKLAGKLVKDLFDNQKTGNTAIVLADETLLEPLLNSLPNDITNINITMGLALKSTSVCNFYHSIFDFLRNAKHVSNSASRKFQYHHQDVKNLFNNQILQSVIHWNVCLEKAVEHIKDQNKNYIEYSDIKELFVKEKLLDDLLENIFDLKHNFSESNASSVFYKINQVLVKETFPSVKSQIEKNALLVYNEIFEKLQKYSQLNLHLKNEKVFFQILSQLESAQKINFLGEPLEGLQIMGMLETRALDFENVILVSANEGILPKDGSENSLIPQELKRLYGLPGYSERDSIFAYYFYRLLQFPGNIHITYNTESDKFGAGEESRFIKQLRLEATLKNKEIQLFDHQFHIPIAIDPLKNPAIEKTDLIKKKLLALFESGLSPSSLNTFVNCPLDFYYQYVLGIKENQEKEINIEADRMGSVIHNTLEELFSEVKEKNNFTAEAINEMFAKVEKMLIKQFEIENRIDFGMNHLIYNVSLSFIQSFLKEEKKQLDEAKKAGIVPQILFLEEKLEATIEMEIEGKIIPVKIKGTADRIDLWGSVTRIIDYKTGSVNETDLNAMSPINLIENPKYAKALQLYAYAYMYIKKSNASHVQSGIISLKSPTKGLMNLKMDKDNDTITTEHLEGFEHILKKLIGNIWGSDTPFVHNPKSTYCKLCQ